MNLKIIKSSKHYRDALRQIEGLMYAKVNTPEGDRLSTLVKRVEAYERRHCALS